MGLITLQSIIGTKATQLLKDFVVDWPVLRKRLEDVHETTKDEKTKAKIESVVDTFDGAYETLSSIKELKS